METMAPGEKRLPAITMHPHHRQHLLSPHDQVKRATGTVGTEVTEVMAVPTLPSEAATLPLIFRCTEDTDLTEATLVTEVMGVTRVTEGMVWATVEVQSGLTGKRAISCGWRRKAPDKPFNPLNPLSTL